MATESALIAAILSSNVDAPALRHRVAGIQHQIQDHLLQLGGIDFDVCQVLRCLDDQFDVLADQPGQQVLHVADDLVQGEHTRLDRLLARNG